MTLSLLQISTISREESPVFITGVPRSGTTMLYNTMLEHSTFRSQAENSAGISLGVESAAFMRPGNVFFCDRADRYLLENQEIKSQFLTSVERIIPHQKLGNTLHHMMLRRRPILGLREKSYQLGLNHLVLRSYFYHAKLARDVSRILEKTPDHIARVPEIKTTFPKAKFVFIHRHPVDVLSSYRKRLKLSIEKKHDLENLGWLKSSVEHFCRIYRRYTNLAFQEKANDPQNFTIVKYEDLVDNPDEKLREVCSFLGESFEAGMIPTSESPAGRQFSAVAGGKFVRQTKQWSDFLSEEDARLLETGLSEWMERLGYPQYTAA